MPGARLYHMPTKNHRKVLPTQPAVVATLHSIAGIRSALGLKKGAIDLVELRLDALLAQRKALKPLLSKLRFPLLLTVRDFSEGGTLPLKTGDRIDLYDEFLEHADLIDLELRSMKKPGFPALAQRAKEQSKTLIFSFHDFKKTPPLAQLQALASQAAGLGADIFKVATRTNSTGDLLRLLTFLENQKNPAAAMGMGPLGKVSRLLLGTCGSRLNYGFLDKAKVVGQWPAEQLKIRLRELERAS